MNSSFPRATVFVRKKCKKEVGDERSFQYQWESILYKYHSPKVWFSSFERYIVQNMKYCKLVDLLAIINYNFNVTISMNKTI